MPSTDVATTCPYCGVGCGVIARRSAKGELEIVGDPAHPANRGRLCSKGSALAETVGLEGRLLHPQIRGASASWSDALGYVASELNRIIAEHGRDAVALYVSGQLLTEDYYVANKLMKGYIGAANIDTNSRLCMSSAVAGHKRAFGEDLVPVCYDDLALADLIVFVGSNAAWCHPVLFQRLKHDNPTQRVVIIDPRRTATCDIADLHLPLRAATDVWLFNGLLAHLDAHGATDRRFVNEYTVGVGHALAVARESAGSARAVADRCGVDEQVLAQFYAWFASTERVVTVFSQGVNQSSAGTDKVNSIINCHLLTGRIGKPGTGPFSVTGQPNAMGGREVGGLATTLAAHMELDNPEHRRIVQEFWSSPRIADRPGLKAVELFDAIHDGAVRALWIMGTNPIVSLPDADKARTALRRCELVVVSDCIAHTDTTELAHVLLPAAAWGEKEGTVTNSDRTISRQRAFLGLPGEARPDWWILAAAAQRMGFERGFEFTCARDVFVEHAALTRAGNDGARALNIGGLAEIDAAGYDELAPTQWPIPIAGHAGTARLFDDARFFHPDGRARFVATAPAVPGHATDSEFPLVLNTGRVRDQWHTMTRSGRAPRLTAHTPEPFIEVHAQDATECSVTDGELARVTTRWGSLVARVRVSGDVRRGSLFVPIHWNAQYASQARVGALVNPIVDPISGEPEFKHTPARIERFDVGWYGFVLSRVELAQLPAAWWTLTRGKGFVRYEIAGREPFDAGQWLHERFGQPRADWIEYSDAAASVYRGALLVEQRLIACVFMSSRPQLPSRTWLGSLFERPRISDAERANLLLAEPPDGRADDGPIVCSCFGVGRKAIAAAIREHALETPQQVGDKVRAGTNCGSCVPEIRLLIARSRR